MNKRKQLSPEAVRRASSLDKLTTLTEKSLVEARGSAGKSTGPGDACGHYEYPAMA